MCHAGHASPRAPLNVPLLIDASDLVVAGTMETSDIERPSGTRLRTVIHPVRVIKGGPPESKTPIYIGDSDQAGGGVKLHIRDLYGIFFLKRVGSAYIFADKHEWHIIAAPPAFEDFSPQPDPLREVAAEVTSVFTIPPDLLTVPSLGVLPNHHITFRRSDATDGSPYVKGAAADLKELVYFEARESLRFIPGSVKIPFLLSVFDSRASVIGRMQALGALLRAGDTSRLQAALPYLLHPDERTSGLVALGLDYLSSRQRDDLVPVSIELLRSSDSSIREGATMIFKHSRVPAVRAALERALNDPDERVREDAVFGVCNRSGGACRGQRESTLAMPDHIPALLALLKTKTAFDP
jgi:hypothetical protein